MAVWAKKISHFERERNLGNPSVLWLVSFMDDDLGYFDLEEKTL